MAERAVGAVFKFHPVVADGDDYLRCCFCFSGGVGSVDDAVRVDVRVACGAVAGGALVAVLE